MIYRRELNMAFITVNMQTSGTKIWENLRKQKFLLPSPREQSTPRWLKSPQMTYDLSAKTCEVRRLRAEQAPPTDNMKEQQVRLLPFTPDDKG